MDKVTIGQRFPPTSQTYHTNYLHHQSSTFIYHQGMVQLAHMRHNTNGLTFTPALQLTNTSYSHRLRAGQHRVLRQPEARDVYLLQNLQAGSEAQPASYSVDTGSLYRVKTAEG